MSDGCLYRLTFPNGKAYIGITNNFAKRLNNHFCAANRDTNTYAVHRAIKKYGRESVVAEALVVAPYEYLKELEARAIAMFETKAPSGYNLTDGGDGTVGVFRSEETLRRMSEAQIGSTRSDQTKTRMRLAKLRKKFTDEHKARIGMAHKGKIVSDETRKKISLAKIGRAIWSDEAREQMSVARAGKKKSPETIAKRVATCAANRLLKLKGIQL